MLVQLRDKRSSKSCRQASDRPTGVDADSIIESELAWLVVTGATDGRDMGRQ